jgi:predicted ArsR family transcriptional regulator
MTGMTIQEVADALGISYFAARQRIVRAGIEPISKEALYPEDTLERVRNVPGKGRPRKPKP